MAQPTFYRSVQLEDLSIFYREAGPKDATTLLLLHGLPSSSRTFEPLFARLSDCYQSDLFYDYRTNVDAYPKWQDWMRRNQPRLLVIWGKYDPSFDISEPEAYRRDVPKAQVHLLDAGHFALDTAANEIAALVRDFLSTSG